MFDEKVRILTLATFALLATFAWVLPSTVAEEQTTDRAEATAQTDSDDEGPALDGATVFAWNCGSCHSERYPSEHTDAEWEVIVTHMRVRANLTGEQADAVLHYLKENN